MAAITVTAADMNKVFGNKGEGVAVVTVTGHK
jgi:hypothetical protein